MSRPDLTIKTPAGRRESGEAAVEVGIDQTNSAPQCAINPDLLATHFCCCKPGVPCVFCLRWHRKITGIEQRRADSLRRQALGRRVAGGL
jgi:hypothetical protein